MDRSLLQTVLICTALTFLAPPSDALSDRAATNIDTKAKLAIIANKSSSPNAVLNALGLSTGPSNIAAITDLRAQGLLPNALNIRAYALLKKLKTTHHAFKAPESTKLTYLDAARHFIKSGQGDQVTPQQILTWIKAQSGAAKNPNPTPPVTPLENPKVKAIKNIIHLEVFTKEQRAALLKTVEPFLNAGFKVTKEHIKAVIATGKIGKGPQKAMIWAIVNGFGLKKPGTIPGGIAAYVKTTKIQADDTVKHGGGNHLFKLFYGAPQSFYAQSRIATKNNHTVFLVYRENVFLKKEGLKIKDYVVFSNLKKDESRLHLTSFMDGAKVP